MPQYETELYKRIHGELAKVQVIDSHEHLQRERELPQGEDCHLGRLLFQYANCDIVSAGMPPGDMERVRNDVSLNPKDRWTLVEPWYRKAWNTAYCECLRILLRDLFGFDDFSVEDADAITEAMRKKIKPGWTRQVFDKAGIDFALTQSLTGPKHVFNPDVDPESFVADMTDSFTWFPLGELSAQSGFDIRCLDDYLGVIDWYFERDGHTACAFKCGRAYDRTLLWEDVPRDKVEKTFNRMLAFNNWPDRRYIEALENFIMHYLCRKCGEYGLRMKFHTGLQEGSGNHITNSRAALMANLFMKYPNTHFDIYHISYPYHEELVTLCKNFPNVTIDFCWMWIINPAAGRRALGDMLDAVPANKIHGFGGDFHFVEGTYGHLVVARREIARVLCEKVEEGRFTEDYALQVGRMLLRDNALDNFDLENRREAFRPRSGEDGPESTA